MSLLGQKRKSSLATLATPQTKKRRIAEIVDNQVILSETDIQYEEDVRLHPFFLKCWWFYLQSKQNEITDLENMLEQQQRHTTESSDEWNRLDMNQIEHQKQSLINTKLLLYERAIQRLPGSYKLWYNYLNDRITHSKHLCITDAMIEETNNCFERCLTFLHKMPRIWQMFTEYLTWQRYIIKTKKVFDRMLKALPITQHDRVWPLYLKFVRISNVIEMSVSVYRRYIQIYPGQIESFIDYLSKHQRYNEACVHLVNIINDDTFESIKHKTKFDLWHILCSMIVKHAKHMSSLNVDAIIRSGIRKYPQEIGKLWVQLAEYYVRLGQFEKGRDIYEEAITTVTTVRDFGIAFENYAKYEETIIAMKMQEMENNDDDQMMDDMIFEFDDPNDLPLRFDRLSNLHKRRRLLLSSVKLRQNPHNVGQWLKRVNIFLNPETDDDDEIELDPYLIIQTFTQAIQTIDAFKSTGNTQLSQIFIQFASFYEEYGEENALDNARTVFKAGIKHKFKNVDNLASVYCAWAEMELIHNNYNECYSVLQKACTLPSRDILLMNNKKQKYELNVQKRLYRNKKIWLFMIDIEQCIGTLNGCKSIYNTMIDLKIISVQNVLNYAQMLENNSYFEESFTVYERGIHIFNYPHILILWKTYLKKFIHRYEGEKLERMRNLFEQCLDGCPSDSCFEIYLMYARIEERYASARHAMRIYDRACMKVMKVQQRDMFCVYINRAQELFGMTRAREIYEKAIQNLDEKLLPDLCLKYISLELKLSEVDRARAIFQFGAQFANPKKFGGYWIEWKEFEIEHGNEDTYKEMLRIRRSVDVQYTQAEYAQDFAMKMDEESKNVDGKSLMLNTFVKGGVINDDGKVDQSEDVKDGKDDDSVVEVLDVNEIELDDEDIDLQQQSIPMAVFNQTASKKIGALERFAK